VGNGFFASASRKKLRKAGERAKVDTDDWQRECWRMFDVVGEYHSACTWISNVISKAKITLTYDGKVVEPGDSKHEAALRALDSLYGGPEEQAEMLRLLGLHMSVAGDCYIVAESGGADADDTWDVFSNLVVKPDGEWYRIEGDDAQMSRKALVIRMWRKHPLNRKKGDSNSRAALPVLSELEVMTQRVAADSESRLTGAGMLIIPNEVTFPSRPVEREQTDGDTTIVRTPLDDFMDMLIEVASTSMTDQSSAVAKVPIVVQMPGDQISNVKLINFWSEYDAAMKELRAEAIRRLSLALDMPPEVLTGMADANHWTAWQMEEAAIKVHTEPLLKLVLSSLNEGYLWPYLEDDTELEDDEIRKYGFGSDTTEMRLRPNRSKEALELHDRALLSDEAVIRENGFSVEDIMPEKQRQDWLIRKLAQGSPTPEMVLGAVAASGVDVSKFLEIMQAAQPAPTPGPDKEPPGERPIKDSLDEHPVRAIPDQPSGDPVAAAADVVVMRVLERVGNKLKNRLGTSRPDGVAAVDLYRYTSLKSSELDELVADEFDFCDRLTTDVPVTQVSAYVRNLLVSQKVHDPVILGRYLALAEYAKVPA
jgi:hypothetical protein